MNFLNYLDGLNANANGTSPLKVVSKPSKGNAKLNVTMKIGFFKKMIILYKYPIKN